MDQFVARVALRLGDLERDLRLWRAGPVADPRDAVRHLRRSWDRRRERVTTLERARAPIAIATAVLLIARAGQLEAVGRSIAGAFRWFPSFLVDWLPDVIGSAIPIALSHLQYLGGAAIIAVSLVAYRIGISIWTAWGGADTRAQFAGTQADPVSRNAVLFYGWTIAHVAVVALVAIVGPDAVLGWIGGVWRDRDLIVQAWGRVYAWSVVGGIVVGGIIWLRRD